MAMDFLKNNPIFVQESSILVHTLLLVGLLVSWLSKLLRRDPLDRPKSAKLRYYRPVILSSLALFAYNLVLCCVNYSILSSDERVVTLLDLALRAVVWLLLTVYLQWVFYPTSSNLKFPLFLRIWWGFYLAESCYGLVTDLVIQCGKHQCLDHFQVLGSDIVYVISGILFCYVGNFVTLIVGEGHDDHLQEPLIIAQSDVEFSPYGNAGFLSNVSFFWVGSLISKGKAKALALDDIPPLSSQDKASESYLIFRNGFKYEDSSKFRNGNWKVITNMQIAKSLIFMTRADILWTFLFSLVNSLMMYVGPYLIDSFVEYLNGNNKVSKNEGYVLVSAFVVAKLVECITMIQLEFGQEKIGLRTKAVLMESIYVKALALSSLSKDGHTSGQMINYMSVDAERVGDFSAYLHDPWNIVLQIAIGLSILYKTLGLASIATLIATVLVMLINYPVSNLFDEYYGKLMESKDKRMKTTTEILKNMRILKLQAWDMKFLSKILELRNVEYEWLKKSLKSMAMTTSIFWVAPIFVSMVTFTTCLVIGVPLTSGKILSAIATFRILQTAIHFLPGMVSTAIQTRVSLSRIASFLSLDELDPNCVEKLPTSSVNNEVAVEITGGNFTWDVSASSPTLKNINLKVECGMRIAICGTVGSGKSTLLSCILGEVPKISGILRLRGSMAYVPQTPWIQSGTISDNILFGKEMEVEKYNGVLEACCLKKDLEILPYGDQTIIGERGINLSGGQKQRVQIARSLYQDADIYLLDDPFSAVDAHTGSHLFKECVLGLLQSKTVMYVTHQMEFLPVADLILVMKEGCIQQAGMYDDILNSGTDFMELVVAHEQALSTLDPTDQNATGEKAITDKETIDEKATGEEIIGSETDDEAKRPKGQLVKEEEREKGRVGVGVYWKYITTIYKGSLVPVILLSQVLFQALQISSNYWIAWATPVSQDPQAPVDGTTLIVVYVSLGIISSLFILVRSLLLVVAGYKTASLLFSRMHFSIFRAPMSFFDANPNSRVLNRVSTDQATVDMNTPNRVGGFGFSVISLLAVIVVMSLVVWQVYMIFIPIIAISLWYQQYYLPAARELFRLVGVTKAPVIQHFTESIAGAAIIRSFGQETRFCETSERLIDGFLKPKFYSSATTQWLNFRLDMLSSLIFGFTLIFLILIPVGSINPVIAGLAVTYALDLNSLQSRVITNFALMENKIISVERILQYTGISSEAPLVVDTNRPDPSWPSLGQIDFQDVQVRYAPQLPLVLRGITCTFEGGKKTGIVGRTGCGKSTLIQALFRIVEPAAGQIIIDGVNISSVGLHDLRSRLSIIPQDPTMFQGTIRGNLDPLEEYTDEQIWEALDKCQLGDEVRNKEGKLDSAVSENGENWSVGQRQLVCLGRVLLKRSQVLVLDEATASVDTATDNVIQQTLRKHFSDSTVITVAHRITSVINSDHVVVLSRGVVEECDTPSRLLVNQSSSFSKLVAEYTTRSKSRI